MLDGTIDAFATDHAPHGLDEKAQLLSAAPVGFSGLEIALGAYALGAAGSCRSRATSSCSRSTRRASWACRAARWRSAARGDVTVFADRPWTVDARLFRSKGKNTPFDGMTLPRRAVATIVEGAVVFEHGRVLPREEVGTRTTDEQSW